MKRMLIFAVIAVALLGAGQALASEVTKVDLTYWDGSTVADINVKGTIRFTHQTEEAKDGKPFRVIVDIVSAYHKLGANNFTSLPDCPIRSIRTSQFSISPEPVVRIVFDLEGEQVYRIEAKDNGIVVHFTDKANRQFASWSTSSATAPPAKPVQAKPDDGRKVKVAEVHGRPVKSAPELNTSIKADRLASLEAPKKDAAPAASVKKRPQAAPSTPRLSKSETHYGPYVDASLLADEPVAKGKEASQPAPTVTASAKTAKSTSPAKEPLQAEPKPVATTSSAKSVPKAETRQGAPAIQEKPVLATAKSGEKPGKGKKTEIASEKESSVKAAAPDKSTSRFRRSPVTSKKIKGTLVAEFPKRLVIKYKARQRRDPFATLIDESKTYDSPVENQVPNVEGLKLVGVIQAGVKDNRALFEDKEGYGYILKTGDKVQKGYVLRVESDRVYFQIFEYGWSRTVALHLES